MTELSYEDRIAAFTPAQIKSMTSEQAGVELSRLNAAYQRSQPGADSAQARLDKFASDSATAAKLFAGDAATVRQFHELSAAVVNGDGGADPLKDMVGSYTGRTGEMPAHDRLAAVDELRSAGIGDAAIMEALTGNDSRTGKPFSVEDVARAKALKAQRMSDPEWTKRLMAGGYAERKELHLWSIILSSAA